MYNFFIQFEVASNGLKLCVCTFTFDYFAYPSFPLERLEKYKTVLLVNPIPRRAIQIY